MLTGSTTHNICNISLSFVSLASIFAEEYCEIVQSKDKVPVCWFDTGLIQNNATKKGKKTVSTADILSLCYNLLCFFFC